MIIHCDDCMDFRESCDDCVSAKAEIDALRAEVKQSDELRKPIVKELHEVTVERDRLREALKNIAHMPFIENARGLAKEVLEADAQAATTEGEKA